MAKSEEVRILIGKELLSLEIGSRIEPIKNLAKKYNASVGLVTSIINELEEEGGIKREKRGVKGSFLLEKDYNILWMEAGIKHLLCVMPLPYLKKYEGLASALKEQLGDKIYFSYMRGGKVRLKFLNEGVYNCAITSKDAANRNLENFNNLKVVYELGENSYLGEHIVLKAKKNPIKIGVDKASSDHQYLVEKIFTGKGYQFVDLGYNELLDAFKRNEIDATIWNLDNLREKNALNLNYEKITISKDLYEGVIIASEKDKWLSNYLRSVIDLKQLKEHQQLVVDNKLIPSY